MTWPSRDFRALCDAAAVTDQRVAFDVETKAGLAECAKTLVWLTVDVPIRLTILGSSTVRGAKKHGVERVSQRDGPAARGDRAARSHPQAHQRVLAVRRGARARSEDAVLYVPRLGSPASAPVPASA